MIQRSTVRVSLEQKDSTSPKIESNLQSVNTNIYRVGHIDSICPILSAFGYVPQDLPVEDVHLNKI